VGMITPSRTLRSWDVYIVFAPYRDSQLMLPPRRPRSPHSRLSWTLDAARWTLGIAQATGQPVGESGSTTTPRWGVALRRIS
jgi:hypothetical protein